MRPTVYNKFINSSWYPFSVSSHKKALTTLIIKIAQVKLQSIFNDLVGLILNSNISILKRELAKKKIKKLLMKFSDEAMYI